MTVNVRLVQSGDFEIIKALLEKEAEDNGNSFEENSPYHPVNSAIAILEAGLDDNNINRGWLGFLNGAPAGIITTPQALPGGIFVFEECRKQGVAQALVKQRESYLKDDLGLTHIERPVRAGNEKSINLHIDNLGYSFSQASLHLLKENPTPHPDTVLYLEKSL